jgi:four helix bundle protein
MKSHKDLIVWQKSLDLAESIYSSASQLPRSEMFGLISQMQRAAIAIPSNIAEGAKRGHRLEYIQFLSIAYGSASELETQLILAQRLYRHINFENGVELNNEVLKMLNKMISSLKKYPNT